MRFVHFVFSLLTPTDYALPAVILGHDYYAIHNDTIFPKSKWLKPNGWEVVRALT